jgi:phosphoglycolate phosphatase
MIKALIFDFDGTIADSFDLFQETLETVLKLPEPLSPERVDLMRNSNTRTILKELKVRKWQLPKLGIQARRILASRIDEVTIFKGMGKAIEQLSADYKVYILSTNSEEAITAFLDKYGLGKTVERLYAGTKLTGKSKRIKGLLKKEGLNKDECIYIGDEIRDIEACQQAGIKCVAVSWGYSTVAALQAYSPEALVNHPAELAKAIHSLEV